MTDAILDPLMQARAEAYAKGYDDGFAAGFDQAYLIANTNTRQAALDEMRRVRGRTKGYDELIVDGVPLGPKNSFDLDPRIVRRYHAFEPGGAVDLAREALDEFLKNETCSCSTPCPRCKVTYDEARAALAALDAVLKP